jgi:tetratricopeptide (TPR) repeat protein
MTAGLLGEDYRVIRFGAGLVRSLRARPLRALAVGILLAVLLAAAGVHLWAWYQLREADRLVERQQFPQAYAHYARGLRAYAWWRWSAAAHFRAARAARRARLYPEAEQHLAACKKLQGGDADTSLPLALENLLLRAQMGEVGEVEEVLWERVKRETPETPLILEALARGYVRMLRLGTAMRCVEMLLERQPDNVEALVMRGWIRQGGAEPGEAVKDYRRALAIDPERDDARLGLAQMLLRESPEEARTHYEQLLARQPDNPEVLAGLATAYRTLGEPAKARALLDTLLAKHPKNAQGLAELGVLTLAGGDAREGEALLRRAVKEDPGNLDAQYQLYLCLVQQPGREAEAARQGEMHKRVEAARKRLTQIVTQEMTRNPNDPNLHYEVGSIYLRYGKPEVGIRWLYSALKLDPTHQPSHQALYDYFLGAGETEKAEQHRRQLRPGTATASPPPP